MYASYLTAAIRLHQYLKAVVTQIKINKDE